MGNSQPPLQGHTSCKWWPTGVPTALWPLPSLGPWARLAGQPHPRGRGETCDAASGAMVFKCAVCKLRARADGSCRNESCAEFRGKQTGLHWQTSRLQSTLGDVSDRVGAFIVGGFALTLLHRHDIRVGIASGMFLRHFVSDTAKRLELLAVLYPSYWRWSTRSVLGAMAAHMDELLRADSNRRADILQEAWDAMEVEMSEYQVVGFRRECRVDLLLRSEAKRVVGKAKDCFGYHPYSNPASRRTGSQEVSILLADLRSGSLWRACVDLAQEWRTNPTYTQSEQVLVKHGIALWAGAKATYGRARLVTLK